MNKRTNRRAQTLKTIPVRHNRIFEVFVMVDGYTEARLPFHFARKQHNGTSYTGPVVF